MTGKRKASIQPAVSMINVPESRARDDNFVAKGHLTKHLTGNQFTVIRERTRINSWEELDYITWKQLLAEDLAVKLYATTVTIHLGCKISKDGEGRKEDVDAIYGLQEEFGEGRKASGLRQATEAILSRRRDRNEPPS